MKNEYLGINLAKYIQNLYSENNKILVKVKDLNKWEENRRDYLMCIRCFRNNIVFNPQIPYDIGIITTLLQMSKVKPSLNNLTKVL